MSCTYICNTFSTLGRTRHHVEEIIYNNNKRKNMKTRNATYTSATTITNHKTTIQGKMETNMEKDHDVDYVEEKCCCCFG